MPLSEPIWDSLPWLQFLQFRFRLLPFATLGSLSAAALAVDVWPSRHRWIPAFLLLFGSILPPFPYLFPNLASFTSFWSVEAIPGKSEISGKEQSVAWDYIVGTGEFLVRGADMDLAQWSQAGTRSDISVLAFPTQSCSRFVLPIRPISATATFPSWLVRRTWGNARKRSVWLDSGLEKTRKRKATGDSLGWHYFAALGTAHQPFWGSGDRCGFCTTSPKAQSLRRCPKVIETLDVERSVLSEGSGSYDGRGPICTLGSLCSKPVYRRSLHLALSSWPSAFSHSGRARRNWRHFNG